MTPDELLEYVNGRTIATMHACALMVAKRNAPPDYIIGIMQDLKKQVDGECDDTPAGKAHAAGFASLLPILQKVSKAANDTDLLLALDTQTSN